MNRTPTCRVRGCANHLDRRRNPTRSPHTWALDLDIPAPGVVRSTTTFVLNPDGSAEVVVRHLRAGQWTPERPVDDVTAKQLIAAYDPPIFHRPAAERSPR